MKNRLLARFAEDEFDWCGLIEKGVRLEGTLHLASTFRIDSEVKGSIFSKAKLILAENSVVEGDVHAAHVTIAGKVTGHIHASERVEILRTGRASGEIHTPQLQIESGGVLDGVCYVPALSGNEPAIAIPMKPAFGE
jgi:cytoskeletal protein CcmA (bactofilin family)